jgi:hypothetical protein
MAKLMTANYSAVRWAQVTELAHITRRLAREAYFSPMENQTMGKAGPFFWRQQLGKVRPRRLDKRLQ